MRLNVKDSPAHSGEQPDASISCPRLMNPSNVLSVSLCLRMRGEVAWSPSKTLLLESNLDSNQTKTRVDLWNGENVWHLTPLVLTSSSNRLLQLHVRTVLHWCSNKASILCRAARGAQKKHLETLQRHGARSLLCTKTCWTPHLTPDTMYWNMFFIIVFSLKIWTKNQFLKKTDFAFIFKFRF